MSAPSMASAAPTASGQEYQKYYTVAQSYQGSPENLPEIAGRFLGSAGRSQEIFNLNVGRPQPAGGALSDPANLRADWYLVLPWDAHGDGVQYGQLPTTVPAPGASPAPSASSTPTSRPTGPPAAVPPPGGCAGGRSVPGNQDQWAALRVAPEHAWNYSRGKGVTVAVVDSGVDANLPALSGRVAVGTDIVSGSGRGDTDCLGTGTAMASIIAARANSGSGGVTGVAPDATILPVRLVTTNPKATVPDQVAAIEFAANSGAKVVVLGTYVDRTDPTVAAAIRDAGAHDAVVVTAALDREAAPSAAPSVPPAATLLRVGAVGIDGSAALHYPAGTVDVVAPGVAVAALGISGVGPVSVTGGQYAAAFVAGEVALVRARFPHLTAAQTVHRIEATTDPVGSPAASGSTASGQLASGQPTSGRAGAGMIDPGLAVTRLLPEEDQAPAAQPVATRPAEPHPHRVYALVIIALLALVTVVLLILRARRAIRPDDPVLGGTAAPVTEPAGAATAGERLSRLSTSDVDEAGEAGERQPAAVPVAPVVAPDETPVEVSVGASRSGGARRREAAAATGLPAEAGETPAG
ncbi:S8 family serine peptidase [Dactylosporangium sp. CA-139066]|uniref:S8 family serine peptidase n=1 Tax=Dactylosporangium sp. CA-139066 TaxID=3239930 RepID=UPI003D90DFF4